MAVTNDNEIVHFEGALTALGWRQTDVSDVELNAFAFRGDDAPFAVKFRRLIIGAIILIDPQNARRIRQRPSAH